MYPLRLPGSSQTVSGGCPKCNGLLLYEKFHDQESNSVLDVIRCFMCGLHVYRKHGNVVHRRKINHGRKLAGVMSMLSENIPQHIISRSLDVSQSWVSKVKRKLVT